MKFNLKNLNPGTKFILPDSKGWIMLRKTPYSVMRDIIKRTTTEKVTLKDGFRYVDKQSDEETRSDLIWDYSIQDWGGIEDQNGKPLECNFQNKTMLMNGSTMFSAFVADCSVALSKMNQEKEEELEKN